MEDHSWRTEGQRGEVNCTGKGGRAGGGVWQRISSECCNTPFKRANGELHQRKLCSEPGAGRLTESCRKLSEAFWMWIHELAASQWGQWSGGNLSAEPVSVLLYSYLEIRPAGVAPHRFLIAFSSSSAFNSIYPIKSLSDSPHFCTTDIVALYLSLLPGGLLP